jgi:hypothetical protein
MVKTQGVLSFDAAANVASMVSVPMTKGSC